MAAPSPLVRVDQVGYLTNETKYGMVVTAAGGTLPFNIRRVSDGVTVFSGNLAAAFTDSASGDSVRTADFTPLTTAGAYYLDVPTVGSSYNFDVGPTAFLGAYLVSTRGFYAQRCGIGVTLVNGGVTYSHPSCHSSGAATDLPSTYHSSSGRTGTKNTGKGWHDAGDYGKYIVNSGISTGELLWTYEFFFDRIGSIGLGIPESANSTPDILDEARWNLEWMLTMQDTDGGVWHKNTSAGFGGFVLPHADNSGTRLIIGRGPGTGQAPYKTSCSTADFAAVMAAASRLFQPFDASFASTCLTAAENAWTWVSANPNVTYTQPTGISTGAYGDGNCADERLWAAAELFRTTGTASYGTYVVSNTPAGTLFTATGVQGWPTVQNLALWTYYFATGGDATLKNRIRTDTLNAATSIANRTNSTTNGYRVSLTNGEYYWGSNGVVANYGVYLLVADRMQATPSYVNAALNNLHYLLGRNTHNVSFVTHVGESFFQNPHHRPSGAPQYAAGPPWPGLLSGGPNSQNNDGSTLDPIPANPPAKRWVDDEDSYASNEIAINWNAPLVFLLASTLPSGAVVPTDTPTASPTRTLTPTPTATRTPTATGTATRTVTQTPTLTRTETPSPTPTSSSTPSPTATRTPTATLSRTPTPTSTPFDTSTPTQTATLSPTRTPSATPTRTPSPTVTGTPTPTSTRTPSGTPTPTRTETRTPTVTSSPTVTGTPTATATGTLPTATGTFTSTATPTSSATTTPSATSTPSASPTVTATSSATPTRTATRTPTASPVSTSTFTSTPSFTASSTRTPTPTSTPTPSLTATRTPSPTSTATFTRTPTATPTSTPLTVQVSAGPAQPGASNVVPGTVDVPVLQIRVQNPGASAAATLTSLTVTASGTGQDAAGIVGVSLYLDVNGNGMVEGGLDILLAGGGTYPSDDGTVTLVFSQAVPPLGDLELLVAYNFSPTTPVGTYRAALASDGDLAGSGGGLPLQVTGAPVTGSIFTVPSATPTPTATGTPEPPATATPTETPVSPSGWTFTHPYPNPSGDGAPIEVGIQAPGPYELDWAVFTLAFRKIAEGSRPMAPIDTFQWTPAGHDGGGLASGLYYLRLDCRGDQGEERRILKIILR